MMSNKYFIVMVRVGEDDQMYGMFADEPPEYVWDFEDVEVFTYFPPTETQSARFQCNPYGFAEFEHTVPPMSMFAPLADIGKYMEDVVMPALAAFASGEDAV